MTVQDILTIIGLFLLYATGLIGVYVNLRIKLKELEIKLFNLQDEFAQHKLLIGNNVTKLEERNTIEHDSISVKIDKLLEKITEIRVDQASNNVINKSKPKQS
ncbi:MAG TPA: hypothetical protein PKM34_02475 [Bacteroidales bacterium]|nr:hypothetical protein [Bacteroidales bacterium]